MFLFLIEQAMGKRIQSILFIVGSIILLVGVCLYMTHWGGVPYMVLCGGTLIFVAQVGEKRPQNESVVQKRLARQQQLGALCLLFSGVFMLFTHGNEWIVSLTIGAFLELYTSFRS